MSEDDPTVAELRHYIRLNAHARHKELVLERVRVGSASFRFLERMTERRLQRECLLTLDMRGQVPDECKSLSFRNRVFWLDATSYRIFLQGLKQNAGLFTVGTYEAIVNGEHTFRGMEAARAPPPLRGPEPAPETAPDVSPGDAADAASTPTVDRPELVPLGYYHARREPRLSYACDLTLVAGDRRLPVRSRDLSPSGLSVAARHPLPVELDQQLEVEFSELNASQNARLPTTAYRVVKIEQADREHRLALARLGEPEAPAARHIAKMIERAEGSAQRRRIDRGDDYLTALSLILEQYYANATAAIPFFVGEHDGRPTITAVGLNDCHDDVLAPFAKRPDGTPDLAPLCTPELAARALSAATAPHRRDLLVACIHDSERDGLRAIAPEECPRQLDWFALVWAKRRQEQTRVFKVLTRPLSEPDPAKVAERIERLTNRAPERVGDLFCEIAALRAAGVLVDVTELFRSGTYRNLVKGDEDGLAAIVLPPAQPPPTAPLVVPFGYHEQRREDRFEVAVTAELIVAGQHYPAMTRDLSLSGLRLEFERMPDGVLRGDEVTVALPELHKRARWAMLFKGVNLKELRYEVVKLDRSPEGTPLLALKRLQPEKAKAVGEFFQDLIDRNRERISLDASDVLLAARARLFASLAAESAASVPFVIFRGAHSRERTLKIALPREAGDAADFFEVGPGEYDFSPLAEPARLAELTGRLGGRGDATMNLYCYRELMDDARFRIVARADFELPGGTLRGFLQRAMAEDHAFVQLRLTTPRPPHLADLNAILDPLMECSPRDANRLRAELKQIVAIGDLIDLTREISQLEGS